MFSSSIMLFVLSIYYNYLVRLNDNNIFFLHYLIVAKIQIILIKCLDFSNYFTPLYVSTNYLYVFNFI